MAKKSPAKVKKLAAEAKRSAASNREMKRLVHQSDLPKSDLASEKYEALDGEWRSIGLAAAARRALVDDGLFQVSDLRKISLSAIKELEGMNANSIRILISELNKMDLSFRK